MKKQITLLLLFISYLTVSSQPTLTHNGVAFQIGTSVTSHIGAYDFPGNPGPGETWDFSNYSGPNVATYSGVNPAGTPYVGLYPAADVCSYAPGPGQYEYLEDDMAATHLLGANAASASLNFSANKQTFLVFPLTYNDTWTDTYQASGNNAGFPFTRTGTITAEADGYGTLITPNGTYTNVLRIYYYQTFTDNSSSGSYDGEQSTWSWYKEGIHYPIFSITDALYDGFPSFSMGTYNDAPTGFDEPAAAEFVSVYPTPANAELFVKLGSSSSLRNYELTDITGRKILSGELSRQLNAINTQNIPAGHYMLRIISDNAVQTKKVVIQ
jgi:hypothetical protein